MIGCKMSDLIEKDDLVLIGHSSSYAKGTQAGKNCYFQAYNGDFTGIDDVNCYKIMLSFVN